MSHKLGSDPGFPPENTAAASERRAPTKKITSDTVTVRTLLIKPDEIFSYTVCRRRGGAQFISEAEMTAEEIKAFSPFMRHHLNKDF